MKGTKRIIKQFVLLITVLIPVFLLLFLKYFGKNHFEVPVMYQDSLPFTDTRCRDIRIPYRIDHFPFPAAGETSYPIARSPHHLFILFLADSLIPDALEPRLASLRRIFHDARFHGKVCPVIVLPRSTPLPEGNQGAALEPGGLVFYAESQDIFDFARCGIFLPQQREISDFWVLLDRLGRIRGYYDNRLFDEVERLEVEMKIILSEEADYDE